METSISVYWWFYFLFILYLENQFRALDEDEISFLYVAKNDLNSWCCSLIISFWFLLEILWSMITRKKKLSRLNKLRRSWNRLDSKDSKRSWNLLFESYWLNYDKFTELLYLDKLYHRHQFLNLHQLPPPHLYQYHLQLLLPLILHRRRSFRRRRKLYQVL